MFGIIAGVTGMPPKVGHYTIVREIGRGGMGVVYLARDERLDRDVAIKAMPEDLAADAARLQRFEREARSLAQLSHPNIAGIYGVEEQDARKYLVLEYVPGQTLGDRLGGGRIPVDEALEFAAQIAAGVEAAHDAGVIHRDLKPDNIKITPEGRIKVLDFGLARSADSTVTAAAADSPTVVGASPTIPGAILGTAAYMSPEQARGRLVDKRTDIWSFGAVLYEMLTGASPFAGETATDSIGAVLHKDVALDHLPGGTPASVRRVLAGCLERDRNLRYRDIGDVRLDLGRGDPVAQPADVPARRWAWQVAGAALVVGGGLGALVGVGVFRSPHAPEPVHLALDLPKDFRTRPTFSPTSRLIGYVAPDPDNTASNRSFLHLRDLTTGRTWKVPPFEGTTTFDFSFSPDGSTIAFTYWINSGGRGIGRVRVGSGDLPATRVFDDRGGNFAQDPTPLWLSNSELLIPGTREGSFCRLALDGGTPVEMLDLAIEELGNFSITGVIDDRHALAQHTTHSDGSVEFRLVAVDLQTGEITPLAGDAREGRVLPGGRLAFLRGDTLCVAPFDGRALRVSGEAVAIAESVGSYSVSHAGDLLISTQDTTRGRSLMIADLAGNLTTVPSTLRAYTGFAMALSRDGSCLGASAMSSDGRVMSGQLIDIDTGRTRSLTASNEASYFGSWLGDGRVSFFVQGRGNVYDPVVADPNFPSERERVLPGRADFGAPASTPDGRVLVLHEQLPDGAGSRIGAVDMSLPLAEREFIPIVTATGGLGDPTLSPDGAWLAYPIHSRSTGQSRVVLRRFDRNDPGNPGDVIPIANESATHLLWHRDGGALYWMGNMALRRVSFKVENGEAVVGEPEQVLALDLLGRPQFAWREGFAMLPDGRFLFIEQPVDAFRITGHELVLNWLEELGRLVPPRE